MTEGGIKVLLKRELIEVKGGTLRRNSIANPSSQYSAGNLRRNSTGKSSSSNAGQKDSIPHYLRASTGSCHDFCKYGRKHEFEEKEKLPVPRRKSTTTIKQHIQVERKKITANNLKVSPDSSDIRSSDPPEIIKREVKVEALSKQKPLDIKKSREKNQTVMLSSTKSIVVLPKGLKPTPVSEKKKLPSSLKASVSPGGGRESDVIKVGKVISVPVKKLRPPPTISLPTKFPAGRAIKSITRKPLLAKVSPPLKDQNLIINTDNGPEKTLYVVEAEIKNDDLKFVQIPSPEALTFPSSSALSFLAEEEEDTEESGYTDTEPEDELVNTDEAKASNGNNAGNRRKGEALISEDNGKSKFRRGKVIEVEIEKNGPRKLKFRRGRILGNNEVEKGDGRRRRFKKKEINKDAGNNCSNNGEKVILRHQDSQEKKDSQGLFNNVIEETANKLAETRISKVKALVGAFETVISLQEPSKPPTPTATSSPSET